MLTHIIRQTERRCCGERTSASSFKSNYFSNGTAFARFAVVAAIRPSVERTATYMHEHRTLWHIDVMTFAAHRLGIRVCVEPRACGVSMVLFSTPI